jgi:DNA-binding CsgD family transcriptional regulator
MSTAHASRACLEQTREIMDAAAGLVLEQPLRPLSPDDDLHAMDAALSATRGALMGALDGRDDSSVGHERVSGLVLESVAVQAQVKDALIEERGEVALGVQQALSALRSATSTVALARRAPIELGRIGFRRALFSRIEGGMWLARTAFAADDADFASALVAVGAANPRRLNGPLIESEMVRRRGPVCVVDPQSNPRVHLQLVRYSDTSSYVAAPVLAWGVPVAMLHADRDAEGEVDDFDRFMLGVYAEGLGLALERTQLMERMAAVRSATADFHAGVVAIADDFTAEVLEGAGTGLAGVDRVRPEAGLLVAEQGERLTPREWDVLRNLASGKTNAQIATGLFVSEGTVKSHVKHILRKLGATNRTEAVARYHRLVLANAASNAG